MTTTKGRDHVWTKLDDKFAWNAKILTAGNAATGAYCRMLSHCGAQENDGQLTEAEASAIATAAELTKLQDTGLLVRSADGWLVPDFLDYNPSRAQNTEGRARKAERQRKWREKHRDA